MSLFTRNGKNTGNADPARAFGSEEQLMAEFSRQDFVRPQQKSGVMSGIRERLSSLTARKRAGSGLGSRLRSRERSAFFSSLRSGRPQRRGTF